MLAERHLELTPYNYVMNNPIKYMDPFGLDTLGVDQIVKPRPGVRPFDPYNDVIRLDDVVIGPRPTPPPFPVHIPFDGRYADSNYGYTGSSGMGGASGGNGKGSFIDGVSFIDKHFNGGLGTVGAAVNGYSKISNKVKRHYAYKLSKMISVKPGSIFQGAKSFANSTGKLVSKLGPAGTVLGVSVITYEVVSGTWDAHTIVNSGLMVSAGVATFFAAPVVLTGIGIYGVADYFFDIGGFIDSKVGRDSAIWGPHL